nr:aspyridones efflux protein apdf [Quercus suber]
MSVEPALPTARQNALTSERQHPSDGGIAAWAKVIGCFLIYLNTWGIATSFGVYQTQYQLDTLRTYSASTISWIGTTQVFLLLFVAIVAGPLHDRGYSRWLLYIGCGLVVVGNFMLSLSSSFWQIVLTQSICIGVGSGLIFVPAVAIVCNAFTAKRPIALGVASTGSAVGGTIFPVLFRQLVPTMGLNWTTRVFGFIMLATSVLAIILLRPGNDIPEPQFRTVTANSPAFLDLSAFREPPFAFLCAGLFFVELGYWIPPFTITPYAQLSLGTGAGYAFYLLAILNAGSIMGRILPAFVAQVRSVGPAWTLVAGSLALGILVLCWIAIFTTTGITIWAVLTGFMSGIAVSIPSSVVTSLSAFKQVGTRSGMMWTVVAFASLIGAPIAGVLVDTSTNSYKWGQLFSGLSIVTGSAMLCVPAVYIQRKRID